MARHGANGRRRMARRLAVADETEYRFLDLSLSNVLWAVWGWHARAYALIILQVCLAAINIRGAQKNDPTAAADSRAG